MLITGGAGFVGANLADHLLSQGRSVRVYDSLARPGTERNLAWLRARYSTRFEFVRGDIRDPEVLHQALDGIGMVFHFAAQVAVTTSLAEPRADFAVNATGTLNLLEALRNRGEAIGLVFTSTNKIYGSLDDIPLAAGALRYSPHPELAQKGIDESRALSFHSPYGCSKGAADQYVLDYARSYGLPAAVFRMSCIYGPHQHGTEDQGWVAHFLIRAAAGRPISIFGDGRQVRDLLYVADLVEAFVRAEECLPLLAGEAFNVGGGVANTISLNELIDLVAELQHARPPVRYDAWRIGDQRWYVSDWRKFARATGWEPRIAVREGVRRLHDWLAANWAMIEQRVAAE